MRSSVAADGNRSTIEPLDIEPVDIDPVDIDGAPALSGGRFGAMRNTVRALVRTPLFLVVHIARIRSIRRRHVAVTQLSEPPPARVCGDRFQAATDGVGPMVLRRYEIDIAGRSSAAFDLLDAFRSLPNQIAATSVAAFMRGDEPATDLAVGDRLLVELAGPWNGPVEVIENTRDAVVMATLDGHMEAGLIRFDVTPSNVGRPFTFRITSWARAGDASFRFLHLTVPIGREIQTAMWVAMCRKAARLAGSSERLVRVETEVIEGARP